MCVCVSACAWYVCLYVVCGCVFSASCSVIPILHPTHTPKLCYISVEIAIEELKHVGVVTPLMCRGWRKPPPPSSAMSRALRGEVWN